MYTEVFAPDSKTNHFNRAVNQLKKDPRCTDLLGNSKKIRAFGEASWNKWTRNRPIAYALLFFLDYAGTMLTISRSSLRKDSRGTEHLIMHFNVAGPLGEGVVNLHMTKRPADDEFNYKYLMLDVKGHPRIYLENADAAPDGPGKNKTKMFGVSWR